MIVGNGDDRYRINADWAKLPDGGLWPQLFPDTPRPAHICFLQKFERVA